VIFYVQSNIQIRPTSVSLSSSRLQLDPKAAVVIRSHTHTHTLTQIHLWPSGLCPGLPRWAGTRTNLDFTEARDSEWQWHLLGYMQICTSPLQADHDNTRTSPYLDGFSYFNQGISFL